MSVNDSVIVIEEVSKTPADIPVILISDESDTEDLETVSNGNRNKRKRYSDIEIIETVVAPKKRRQEINNINDSQNAASNSKDMEYNRVVTRGYNSDLSIKITNSSHERFFIDTQGSGNMINGISRPFAKTLGNVLKPIGNNIGSGSIIKPTSLFAKKESALQSFRNNSTASSKNYTISKSSEPVILFQNPPMTNFSASTSSFSTVSSTGNDIIRPTSPKTLVRNGFPSTISLTEAIGNTSEKCKKPGHGKSIGVKKNDISYREATSLLKVIPVHRLRPIAIDGSNVAMLHGKGVTYSCLGIKICVDYFVKRGHDVVKAFVPQYRRRQSSMVTGQNILEELAQGQQYVVFTPSRTISGRDVVCYDDRFILDYAISCGAVIVSNDNYRDIRMEKQEWMKAVHERLLMFTFVDNLFLVPDDPLGRDGPTLNDLLKF